MAFNEEAEELEFNSVFSDDDEEYDEEPEEFRDYSEDELSSKWGAYTFEDLVFELSNILGRSKKYFFSKKKRVIEAEEMANLTKLIADKLPDEIVNARNIISNHDNIIAGAKKEAEIIRADANGYHQRTVDAANAKAEQIIADARAKADQLVSEHQITLRAKEEGAQIVAKAQQDARGIIEKTSEQCDMHIERVMQWADENINGVNEYVYGILGAARESFVSGIGSIDAVKTKYTNNYNKQASSLKSAPRITRKN